MPWTLRTEKAGRPFLCLSVAACPAGGRAHCCLDVYLTAGAGSGAYHAFAVSGGVCPAGCAGRQNDTGRRCGRRKQRTGPAAGNRRPGAQTLERYSGGNPAGGRDAERRQRGRQHSGAAGGSGTAGGGEQGLAGDRRILPGAQREFLL